MEEVRKIQGGETEWIMNWLGCFALTESSDFLLFHYVVNKLALFSIRVSTLEAVAAFLTEMGEESAVCEALMYNMRIKMDMVLVQKHRPMLYGTNKAHRSREI